MHLKDLLKLIEEIAPHQLSEPWDNSGLQIGSHDKNINVIYFSLDPTLDNVKKAALQKADLLITHHPLIFRPISNIKTDEYPGNVIKEAIEQDISIVSIHTNLDSAINGINYILANKLSLIELEVLKESELSKDTGLGIIGNLAEPVILKDFIIQVKEIFGLSYLRLVKSDNNLDKLIKRIAVVGGSGGSLIQNAIQKGAELMITGDIGYHDALKAIFNGLILIDVGHFPSEKVAFNKFAEYLSDKIKERGFEIEVYIDKEERNPFEIK